MPRPPRAVKKTVLCDKNDLLKNEKNKSLSPSKKGNCDSEESQFENFFQIYDKVNREKILINEQSESKENESPEESMQTEDLEHYLNAFSKSDFNPLKLKQQTTELSSTDLDSSEEDPFGFVKAERKVKSYFKKRNTRSLKDHDEDGNYEENHHPGEFEIFEIAQDDNQLIGADCREDPRSIIQITDNDLDADEANDLLLDSVSEKQGSTKSRKTKKEESNGENEGKDKIDLSSPKTPEKDTTGTNDQQRNKPTVIKTSDLLDLLPRRRHVAHEDKGKGRALDCEDNEHPKTVAERELKDRIRYFEEIDKYSLPVEEA
ncbi:16174_t:CDS:2 [Acaulospora morrowiae]|uniref:16174_t:CDS:1 n=1 Tax=Acaulospora morrowiae TaxID=94023 RepID=A0A9N8ZKD4_9GLOM|nr:16174_t:CDS:2 [Acaulospora morrowiae]